MHQKSKRRRPAVSDVTNLEENDNDRFYLAGQHFQNALQQHLDAINISYGSLPVKPTHTQLCTAYEQMCRCQIFSMTSKQKMFPISRYLRHCKVRHPTASKVCTVTDDRRIVRCELCKWEFNMTGRLKKWHKPNVIKHFLSKDHWDRVTSTAGAGTSVEESTQQQQRYVHASNLIETVINDAIFTCCSKSLPHTAIEESLNCTARALLAVKGVKALTSYDIL